MCTGHDYSQPGKPRIDWDDPAAKDALVSALVNDANALVAALEDRDLDEQAASAVALLALVAGQDVEPAEGSDGTDGRWRIARKVAEDRVISVNDPDARHTRKSPEARRDGYRAHVAAEPATGLITDEQLTRAAGPDNSDAAVAARQMIAREAAPAEVYGDSAYGTGDLRAALTGAGHQLVIKPGPLKPAVEGGFTTDDFTVDETAGTVTCPAGVTRPITARRAVIFGAACRTCPLRSGARPPKTAAPCTCTSTTRCCAPPGRTGLPSQPCARATASTAPTSSGSSPRSPAAAGGASSSATAAPPGTTPGSSTGPPPSTCATSSAAAWPARTAHGYWPDPSQNKPASACSHRTPARLAQRGERPRCRPAAARLTAAQTALPALFPPQITLCSGPS